MLRGGAGTGAHIPAEVPLAAASTGHGGHLRTLMSVSEPAIRKYARQAEQHEDAEDAAEADASWDEPGEDTPWEQVTELGS